MGTVYHARDLAPEILRNDPHSEQSELWSFGVLLYEMLTGSLPFTGKSPFELASAILESPVPPLPPRISEPLASHGSGCSPRRDRTGPGRASARTRKEGGAGHRVGSGTCDRGLRRLAIAAIRAAAALGAAAAFDDGRIAEIAGLFTGRPEARVRRPR